MNKINTRKWLSKPDGDSQMSINSTLNWGTGFGGAEWVDAQFIITQYTKSLAIDFNYWDEKSAKNVSQELLGLIASLTQFHKDLGKHYKAHLEEDTEFYKVDLDSC